MNTDQHIRIALAEDHQLLRNTLTTVLNSEEDFEVVLAAAHGKELLDGVEGRDVDVIILDLNMPVLDGREALKVLVEEYPHIHVIIVTMYFGKAYIEKYMTLGARGYLSKDCAPENLTKAIRDVYHSGYFIHHMTPVKMISLLIERGHIDIPQAKEPLTNEEIEMIKQICDKREHMEITENTVALPIDSQHHELLQKIGARDATYVLAYAMKHGLYSISA